LDTSGYLNQKLPKYTKALRAGSGPSENIFLGPSNIVEPAKHLYTKLERLTLSGRVTWFWSEKANLYSRQTVILSRETKT
jgi:hypothetical protein